MARTVQARRMGVKKRRRSYKRKTAVAVDRYRSSARTRRVQPNVSDTMVSTKFGMPDVFETTLVYCDSIILTPGVTNFQEKVYNMNSLYDPDTAIGGGQPYWFDQLTAMYNRYSVTGSKLIATFTYDRSSSSTAAGPWICGVSGDANTTLSSSNASVLCASQNTDYQVFGPNSDKVDALGWYSPRKCLNLDADDEAIGSAISGSPAKNWYNHVWATAQGTSTTTTVNVLVRMEFRVRFTQLLDNAGS